MYRGLRRIITESWWSAQSLRKASAPHPSSTRESDPRSAYVEGNIAGKAGPAIGRGPFLRWADRAGRQQRRFVDFSAAGGCSRSYDRQTDAESRAIGVSSGCRSTGRLGGHRSYCAPENDGLL